jgi:hypothetical protein
MNDAPKQYAPVGPFEKASGICPLYIAWIITDELEHYFWVTLPDNVCDQLADRTERVFAHNPDWRRKFKGRYGRAYLLSFMRHWLASILSKTRPDLFRQLPQSYLIGYPLFPQDTPRRRSEPTRTKTTNKASAPPSTTATYQYVT